MTKNKYKILLVEDEPNICNLIATMLETAGYQTIPAESCSVAETLYAVHLPDLIILDLDLSDRGGINLLEWIRKDSQTLVIVLCARADEKDKIDALDKGADDYVTKPFGMAELLDRVKMTLCSNRCSSNKEGLSGGKFTLKDLEIDYDARQVILEGAPIRFTQTEYSILALLSENCGKMMTYSTIIREIWGGDVNESSIKTLQVNMANIRRKFGARPGEANYIINELGVGYRMNAERG